MVDAQERQEKADLVAAVRNREKLFVFSERRFGKTSLVKSVLARLPKKQTVAAYVDLWPTDSEAAFVITLSKSASSTAMFQAAKQGVGRRVSGVGIITRHMVFLYSLLPTAYSLY